MMRLAKTILLSLLLILGIGYGVYTWMNLRTYQVFGELVAHVNTKEKLVALTFDDGPTENTARILELLDEQNIHATFFLVGDSLAQNPDLGKAIAEQEHQIGNHSYSHERMVFKTPKFIKSEIEKTDEEIRKTGYEGSLDFRPPYGKKLLLLPWYVSAAAKKTIMWDVEVDSTQSSEDIAKHVNDHVTPGSIILLHPMHNTTDLDAIPLIIKALKKQGYGFLTVDELLTYEEK